MTTVDSAGDDRTANNAVRHEYRVLSTEEKLLMVRVKDAGAAFITMLSEIGGTRLEDVGFDGEPRLASRDLSLARTHMEDAVMRAVRHITRG